MYTQKSFSTFRSTLPDHLGFGELDPSSIRLTSSYLSADYRLNSELVYRVRLDEHGYQLEEFFDGQIISRGQGHRIEEAFFSLGSLQSSAAHPRLQQLADSLVRKGNVFIHYPNQVHYLYFPAGLLFGLFIPILEINHDHWIKFKSGLNQTGSRHLQFQGDYLGSVLRLGRDGWISEELVDRVELTCPLVDLEAGSQTLLEQGVVLPDEDYPLIITPLPFSTPNPILVRPGYVTENYQAIGWSSLQRDRPDGTREIARLKRTAARTLSREEFIAFVLEMIRENNQNYW